VEGPAPAPGGSRLARDLLAPFAEVELVCPPDVCRTRERAVRWNIVPCPGPARPTGGPELGFDYAPPAAADLTVNTDALDTWAATDAVLGLIARLQRAGHGMRLVR
jgi:hypothetical protein